LSLTSFFQPSLTNTLADYKHSYIMDVKSFIKLGAEFREQFSEDIQHDLTYNLREGYEAEEVRDTKYFLCIADPGNVFTKHFFLFQISHIVCTWQAFQAYCFLTL
jgi:hypothetical protein